MLIATFLLCRIVFVPLVLRENVSFLLENYFLSATYPGKWIYNSQVVTDQSPLEIAKMCVWEKLLDHLPKDIPYIVKVVRVRFL